MGPIPQFHFQRWIKSRRPAARISLAESGIPLPPESVLPLHQLGYRLSAPVDQYEPLVERVAVHLGVNRDQVALVAGATYALHLLTRVLMPETTRVVVETPTYELLWRLPDLCGGGPVKRIPRELSHAGTLPMDLLEPALEGGGALLLLTVPHNPTGVLLSEDSLIDLVALAEVHDARVAVDEVYLGYHPASTRTYRSLASVSERFCVTGSLSKVFGLDGLRVGWVAGPPEIIARVRRLDEFLMDRLPSFSAQAATFAFDHRAAILEYSRGFYTRHWPKLQTFGERTEGVTVLNPGAGVLATILIPGDIDALALSENLLAREGVLVAPAEMFGGKGFLRVSMGLETEPFEEGLAALTRAIARAANAIR